MLEEYRLSDYLAIMQKYLTPTTPEFPRAFDTPRMTEPPGCIPARRNLFTGDCYGQHDLTKRPRL